MNKSLRLLLNLLVSLGLGLFILSKLHPEKIAQTLSGADLKLLALALPLVAAACAIRSRKWMLFLDKAGLSVMPITALKLVLIGAFYSLLTPGKVGELGRSAYFGRKKPQAFATVLWDRLVDASVLGVLAVGTILALISDKGLIALGFILLAAVACAIALFTREAFPNFVARLLQLNHGTVRVYLATMKSIAADRRLLLQSMLFSVGYYCVNILLGMILIKSLGGTNLLVALTLPLIILTGAIPISIAGLGLREGAAVVAFAAMGAEPELAFSFSLLNFTLMSLLPGLFGYFLSLKQEQLSAS